MRSERIISEHKDWFLEHPPIQPKAEIGAYVESQGILVPQRFENLKEAISSGKPFIIRSEHPQDYDGISGMMESQIVDSKNLETIKNSEQKEVEEKIINDSLSNINEYCRLTEINPEDFKKNISFSYWEFISGKNITIIADSAILNRYHVFYRETDDLHRYNLGYFMYENGSIIQNEANVEGKYFDKKRLNPKISSKEFLEKFKPNLEQEILFYDSVRKLEKFDSNNVPLMELARNDDGLYFLQYHRGRSFSPSTFVLSRELTEGEIEVDFVRGTTSPGGIICKTAIFYPEDGEGQNLVEEEASFDLRTQEMFSELMTKNRKVQFNHNFGGLVKACNNHFAKSILFNSSVSIIISSDKKLDPILFGKYSREEFFKLDTYEGYSINIFVESDGRRAIIKRVD